MTSDEIIEAIDKHCLCVRKLPNQIVSVHEIRHRQSGDEVIMYCGREMCRSTRIPKHAGWYMVKPADDTGSITRWDLKTDNAAPTLEGSVKLYLSKAGQ